MVQQHGLAETREKARAMILAGQIHVNGQRMDKPGTLIAEEASVERHGDPPRYVSRGGFKLEKALHRFHIDLTEMTVMDVGASTGGYTDCALQHGAARVYAVDVGYGQLAWTLRNDPRVVNIERKNIRNLSPDEIGERVGVITVDVSFISTELVFPVLVNHLAESGLVIALIKPQFEAGRDQVGKHGVVRDPLVHQQVLNRVLHNASQVGLSCHGITYSPITGPKGNIEFLIILRKSPGRDPEEWKTVIEETVTEAHRQLRGM